MAGRVRTVLFAEVSGRDEFVRAAGPVIGWNGISECIDRLTRTARSSGGRVVKVIGSEVMMLFDTPDAAAGAASMMHAAVNALPPVSGARLSVKVGYHAGPVIEGNDDLLGDTVNLVARLVRQARAGETMTTPQTAKLLTPQMAKLLNSQSQGYPAQVHPAAPAPGAGKREAARAQRMMRLSFGSEAVICGPDNTVVVVGRDPNCGLVTATAFASRRHCTIFWAPDVIRIRDHSSYGTFLSNEGCEEIELLNGQEATLSMRGSVSLGCSRLFAARLLEFTGS
jgi:adenylate cyclase